ncbi:hypothetical protein BV898_05878 [Hypsibius exemplaris]|uniref:Uncharacterized protein n=1 Tax=Hypsibius exemplaris TaxID=2072580 RepID=A0A1W0WY01_HYPEX|nr:hypothetical protein BV898_05878 [Hypsibius exemplaris]
MALRESNNLPTTASLKYSKKLRYVCICVGLLVNSCALSTTFSLHFIIRSPLPPVTPSPSSVVLLIPSSELDVECVACCAIISHILGRKLTISLKPSYDDGVVPLVDKTLSENDYYLIADHELRHQLPKCLEMRREMLRSAGREKPTYDKHERVVFAATLVFANSCEALQLDAYRPRPGSVKAAKEGDNGVSDDSERSRGDVQQPLIVVVGNGSINCGLRKESVQWNVKCHDAGSAPLGRQPVSDAKMSCAS